MANFAVMIQGADTGSGCFNYLVRVKTSVCEQKMLRFLCGTQCSDFVMNNSGRNLSSSVS